MTSKPAPRRLIKNNEIDVSILLLTIWNGRKLILKTIGVFIILGLLIAIFSPKEYSTSIKLMPETSQNMDLGSLSGLASQFGLGGVSSSTLEGGALSPELYPTIVTSISFIKDLMDFNIYLAKEDSTMSVFNYITNYRSFSLASLIKKVTVKLPYTIINVFKEKRVVPAYGKQEGAILYLTYEEWEVYEDLLSRISFDIDSRSGIVTMSVKIQDEYLAAVIANKIKDSLLEYLVDYKTEKTRTTLEFVEEQLQDATNRFEKTQEALAIYRDQNQGIQTQLVQTVEQRLVSEYDLAFKVYSAMAQKRDEMQLKLQENTPIVKILQPAFIPKEKSSPRRGFIMIMSTFLGAFLGVGLVFGKEFWFCFKAKSREVDHDDLIDE